MVDHHFLLVLAGFALGSAVHQAVTHYHVPVTMVARAAVAAAKKTIVDAFERESDGEEDCDSTDAKAGPQQQAPQHAYPLAIARPGDTQIILSRRFEYHPPARKPHLPRTLQLQIQTFAAVPALPLEYSAVWAMTNRPPRAPAAGPGVRYRGRLGGQLSVGTLGFVAAAAIIGVSCFWYAWFADTSQHQEEKQDSSRPLDTTAVLRVVGSARRPQRQNPAAAGCAADAAAKQYSQYNFYIPHNMHKLHVPSTLLQRMQSGPVVSPAVTDSKCKPSSGTGTTEAVVQQQRFKQQHLGVALHELGGIDREYSLLLHGVVTSRDSGPRHRPESRNSKHNEQFAALVDLRDQWESSQIQIAESLVERAFLADTNTFLR